MSNFVTITFNVDSKLTSFESDFFHLDAEIIHKSVESAQILNFNEDTKECVAELFIGSLTHDEFVSSLAEFKLSVSLDNIEVDYSILKIS